MSVYCDGLVSVDCDGLVSVYYDGLVSIYYDGLASIYYDGLVLIYCDRLQSKLDLTFVSVCSMYNSMNRSVLDIHSHVAGVLVKQANKQTTPCSSFLDSSLHPGPFR